MTAERSTPVLGSHLSIAKGFTKAGRTALAMGANTFQFFTRNPRGGRARALDADDLAGLEAIVEEHAFGPLLAHAPYTLNLASPNAEVRRFGREVLADDLARMERLPTDLYNFHPGSHVKEGSDAGIERIVSALDACMVPEQSTVVLLETMSGKGSEVGSTFEELREILDAVRYPQHMGVCLDTCHVFDAGYDLKDHLEDVIEHFDQVIGLDRLRAVHLNDSRYGLGSHKDRHAGIGEGTIGLEGLLRVMRHPALAPLPFFLETPYDDAGHAREIDLIRRRLAHG